MSLYALGPGYVSRATEKAQKRKTKEQHRREIYRLVDLRDGMVCRATKRRLVRSLELKPNRREHHHIIPLSACGPTETWNIVNVSLEVHERITRNLLTVEGDADGLLTFTEDGRTWKG